MIERDFINQKTKEYYIKDYVESRLRGAEISSIKLKKIPLGEKIIITTSRPSLIVGSKGANIRSLTKELRKKFKLENPQIEIIEVKNLFLDANVVASRIASSLERFGSSRFKGVGHKSMDNVLKAGALGVEILMSGKIPGARAKRWRFYQGYLKKCGDISMNGVKTAYASALLKTGIIGIQVRIMPPNLELPDHVEIFKEIQQLEESKDLEVAEEEKKPVKKRKTSPKKSSDKKETTKQKKVTKKKVVKKKLEEPKVESKEETNVEPKIDSPKEEVKTEIKEVLKEVVQEKEVIKKEIEVKTEIKEVPKTEEK
ncbi:30S ribosomal protein S3 [archaeon]|jgi:small subunit ribosomal protein S3|nr:30S ribosomal protein S3 [archaeon]MBT3450723.1 30S ribosomal protein S3 [archaeon]MBT6869215.1 30S ribosomal protein S3 [archaeon]MBT7193751.1 30S ribosomal protein S3 [archaeon]MBT7381398.1 30S ribosomal protein S3 [archaeon]